MNGFGSGDFRSHSVLLVEDDSNDQLLLRRALLQVAPRLHLRMITDGHSAIEHLSAFQGSAAAQGVRKPFLVLLDVHLPRKSGWEVLRWMRGQAAFSQVPVLVWTSLPNTEGAAKARELDAQHYFSKPRDLAGYLEIAAVILKYLGD